MARRATANSSRAALYFCGIAPAPRAPRQPAPAAPTSAARRAAPLGGAGIARRARRAGAGCRRAAAGRSRTLPAVAFGRSFDGVGRAPACRRRTPPRRTAVERDRKLAQPVAPNRLPDAPLPNDGAHVGALAVLDQHQADHRQRREDLQHQHEIHEHVHSCRLRWVRASRAQAAARQMATKSLRLQRRAADQAAVDVGLREQLRRVVGLDAAAVEDLHRAGVRGRRLRAARAGCACTACACSGVAVLPVPIAQTGS